MNKLSDLKLLNSLKIDSKTLFLILNIVILFCELVVSYAMATEAMVIVFVIHLSLLIILQKDLTNSFVLCLSFVPFNEIILVRNRELNIFAAVFFVFLLRLLYSIIRTKDKKELQKMLWCLLGVTLFALYYMVGMYVGQGVDMSYMFVLLTIITVFVGIMQIKNIDVLKVYHYYLIMFFVSAILGAMSVCIPELDKVLKYVDFEGVVRFRGLAWDTNFFAMQCACNVGILLALVEQKRKNKWFYAICLVGAFFAGLATISKMYIVVLGVIFLLWLLFSKTNIKIKLCILAIAIVSVVALYFILPEGNSIRAIMDRFIRIFTEHQDLNTILTDRWRIWSTYMIDWVNSGSKVLFGLGVNYALLPLGYGCHGFYLELLYQFGLVGTLLMATVFGLCVFVGRKQSNIIWFKKDEDKATLKALRRSNLVNFIGLIALLVCYFALSVITDNTSVFLLLVGCLVLDVNKEKKASEI